AYEVTPVVSRWDRPGKSRALAGRVAESTQPSRSHVDLPAASERPPLPAGIEAAALSHRIDQFLASRGYQPQRDGAGTRQSGRANIRSDTARAQNNDDGVEADFSRPGAAHSPEAGQTPLDFVCEDDVRRAIQAGRKLTVSERAIVTPSARELGEQHRIFLVTPWRG